jgi:hypothetical protein
MLRIEGRLFTRFASPSGYILLGTGLHLFIALLTYLAWIATGNDLWLAYFFDFQGALFFLLCDFIGFWLSLAVWRKLSPGDAMKTAWSLISLSFVLRVICDILTQLLGINSSLLGQVIGGPGAMILLAGGLLVALRVYRRLGMLARLTLLDYILVGAVATYTLRFTYDLLRWQSDAPVSLLKAINWLSDPLLSLLLFEAIFIRRSVIRMGPGLISRCWGAFTAGIFFTSVGDMGLWAVAQGYLNWPQSSITWYIWFLASAAYALGPAYQAQAMCRASKELAGYEREKLVEFA